MNENQFFLNIAEEIYLLTIDENGNQHQNFRNQRFDIIIASSILMELAMRHIIDTDMNSVIPDKMDFTGDIILDDAIDEMKSNNSKKEISEWISHISLHGQFYRDEIISTLIGKKVLKLENKKTLWFFASRKYPLQNDKEVKEVRLRLRDLIFSNELPDIRDIVLISILHHAKLINTLLTKSESIKFSARIEQIAKMDFIGQAISKSLSDFSINEIIGSKIRNILKEKTPEEKLQEHIEELKNKFKINDDSKLPSWLRKGTHQYKASLQYVSEVGTAEITFNPKTRKYSKLNFTYYGRMGGGEV
ncbi:MAG: hypothetical protein AUJ98_06835 [Bacteroidetes bacterium CG2_30_33_31]|nr:MAG: hypothetical protein AUJ98_06835 [Bacteroidetes bacterium CG2_30_33_31]